MGDEDARTSFDYYDYAGEAESSNDIERMESTYPEGDRASVLDGRPSSSDSSQGPRGGQGRGSAETYVDHLRKRHSARIPEQITEPEFESELIAAFSSGDPALVYTTTQRILARNNELARQAAELRFLLNFGSELCHNCEGLRAGPGVAATCFQVQRCNFTNVKENSESPQKLRVLRNLAVPSDQGSK